MQLNWKTTNVDIQLCHEHNYFQTIYIKQTFKLKFFIRIILEIVFKTDIILNIVFN